MKLLDAALKRRGIEVSVTALINDTVGTLITGAYEMGADKNCAMGVILGTGMMCCHLLRRRVLHLSITVLQVAMHAMWKKWKISKSGKENPWNPVI